MKRLRSITLIVLLFGGAGALSVFMWGVATKVGNWVMHWLVDFEGQLTFHVIGNAAIMGFVFGLAVGAVSLLLGWLRIVALPRALSWLLLGKR